MVIVLAKKKKVDTSKSLKNNVQKSNNKNSKIKSDRNNKRGIEKEKKQNRLPGKMHTSILYNIEVRQKLQPISNQNIPKTQI